MLAFSRRFAASLVTLALAAGQAGVCAGWLPTPEARMACCSDDEPCPMHRSGSKDESPQVTQAEADRCCALSKQDDSAPSPTSAAFFAAIGIILSPVPALVPEPRAHVELWRASVPIPTAHVPKHLLLSVFVV